MQHRAIALACTGALALFASAAHSATAPIDIRRTRMVTESGRLSVAYEGKLYWYFAPPIIRDGVANAVAQSTVRIFDKPRTGARMAVECAVGRPATLELIGRFGTGMVAGHTMYKCRPPRSGETWFVHLPPGVAAQIDQALERRGGKAARRGLFGREGTVVFLGEKVNSGLNELSTIGIRADYWAVTGRAATDEDFLAEWISAAQVGLEVGSAIPK
jgi:hypothetical protein